MAVKLSFLMVEFSLILCALLFQETAGIGSLLLPIKVKTSDFRLYGGRWQFMLLQNALAPSPTSTHTRTGQKGHGTFHAQAPSFHSSINVSPHKNHHSGRKFHHISPVPYHQMPPAFHTKKGHGISPSPSPGRTKIRPLPLPAIPSDHRNMPWPSPTISPSSSPTENDEKTLPPIPTMALPPPPPNQGCKSVTCTEPLTYTPPGSPCGCVWPIEVKLRFSISLYTFFPLVSDLSQEISDSVSLNRSQVRIMGADAVDQEVEKTIVLIKLVPVNERFEASKAFSIYSKFWNREINIKSSVFGVYEVIYVSYPGLPPSPPSRPSVATINIPGSMTDDGPIKPLGVDLSKRRQKESGKNTIVIIVISSVTAFVVFTGCILLFLSKCGCSSFLYTKSTRALTSSDQKPSGGGRLLALRSRPSSASMSFNSSLIAWPGTAKIFTIDDMERATDHFDPSRILGEGGFGLVYGGVLDDGREVAVKVLKRDDQQGSREFLAEVEMLSRLHHRNLVKLIGICPEDKCRCLVYELIPNGSVESHLHGVDKDVAPLDWCSRMKIALGAARGLAYLHEDSNPRVIHRDFKSSNILLEHDFTPKVSDFGLARTAMDEGNKHVSTHVMGTFGYLAPEYAMTGHLLVKSDVYSYGVVLLELLTGRKPVDLSQPPGQENLVSWARPLLSADRGLETLIDPTLRPNAPLDSAAKVAAIASMCVQPEVSHRPFMGEVVQALKLLCNEFEEIRETVSRSFSQEELSVDIERELSNELMGDSNLDDKIALSAVDLKSASVGFEGQESESFRRQFNSAPLAMGRKRKFWQRLKGMSKRSMSEHEFSSKV